MNRANVRLYRTDDQHIKEHGIRISRGTDVPVVEGEPLQDPESRYRLIHDPSHPHADEEGYVKMPDIEIVNEMVDMMAATRAYEANTVAISSAKQMAKDALDI